LEAIELAFKKILSIRADHAFIFVPMSKKKKKKKKKRWGGHDTLKAVSYSEKIARS
jgi:hypothetical protein